VYGKTFEATEGTIKNEQSRDNDNIGYTRHRNESNKTKTTAQKIKMMSNTDSIKNGGELRCSQRVCSSCLL
jgi:hypothetical protein